MNDLTTPKYDVITMELPTGDYETIASTFEEEGYEVMRLPAKEKKILRQLKIAHRDHEMLTDTALKLLMRKVKNKSPMPMNSREWGRKRSPY